MSKNQLPSLASFEDKKITSGLKFILGGTVTRTEGGNEAPGGGDYVADATNGSAKIYGLCKNHVTADAFFLSESYRQFVEENP